MLVGVTHREQDAGEAIHTSDVGWLLRIVCARGVDGLHLGKRGPVSGPALVANEIEFTQLF